MHLKRTPVPGEKQNPRKCSNNGTNKHQMGYKKRVWAVARRKRASLRVEIHYSTTTIRRGGGGGGEGAKIYISSFPPFINFVGRVMRCQNIRKGKICMRNPSGTNSARKGVEEECGRDRLGEWSGRKKRNRGGNRRSRGRYNSLGCTRPGVHYPSLVTQFLFISFPPPSLVRHARIDSSSLASSSSW